MRIRSLSFIGSLIVLIIPAILQAQAQLPKDTVQTHRLTEVLINDNRLQIPYSRMNRDVTVLDAPVIQSLPVHSINELLGFVAGVDIRQRGPWGGQADISLNGGTFDQTLVLLNGFKIIDPQTGHNMMNLPVSIDAIERIEVLKGPAASAYGINALSGAINIITRQPQHNEALVTINTGSSFERDTSNNKLFGGIGVSASASMASENVRHFLSLSTQQSTGHRYNTSMNNNRLFYQNAISLKKKNQLRFMAGYVSNDFGANGFYAPPGDAESREIVKTAIAAAKGDFQINERWTVRPSVSYRYNHDDYIFIRKNPDVYENIHFSHVLEASVNNAIQVATGVLGIGVEYRSEAIKSNSLGDHGRGNIGFYAEYGLSGFKNFSMNAGAYVNYSDFFGWQVLPSLDAGYRLNDSWRIFANAGTGTRVPTYTDWYYKGPQNIGNSELKPENAFHAEGGVKFSKQNLQGSASYFYRRTTDFIDWVKKDVNDPWQPQNFQKIKTPGVSLQADYRMIPVSSETTEGLLLGVSYTWLHPTVMNADKGDVGYSHYALENLQNQAILRVTSGLTANFNATVAARYEQRVNYKDYVLMDARLEARFSTVKACLSLNNLLNVTYIETGAAPLPGRWLTLGIQWGLR